jgi:hypothetical protein
MKALKLLTGLFLTATLLSSCVVTVDDFNNYDDSISLEELVTSYDLWSVDYNRTTGNVEIPFLSKAFTVSFQNGRLYANNNLAGIGAVGNGLGLQIGFYNTINGVLEIDHNLDGFIDVEVSQISNDEIRVRDTFTNTTYYLVGYFKNTFDYDLVFYDNIEYFLQEYVVWEKSFTSNLGALNDFDNENYLEFTPGGNTSVFRSSQDDFGTNIDFLNWNFIGDYEVYDVEGFDDLKILTLDYDFFDNEEFELSVINDGEISLYHQGSGTTYEFIGKGNIQFKKGGEKVEPRNKKRFKTDRKTKKRNIKA